MTPTTSCSELIPAGPRRRSRTFTLLFASAVVVLALAGCGGDSGFEFTNESVSSSMSDAMRAELPAGATMDQLDCVQDGDDQHWRCVSFVRTADGSGAKMTVAITCDPEDGRCLSEPASIVPVP